MSGNGRRDTAGGIEGRDKEIVISKALLKGHFLLSSGYHSEYYFEKFRILEDPRLVRIFSEKIAEFSRKFEIQWIVGPFTGGAILAFDVAYLLGVKCAYAEKSDDRRVLRRGFSLKGYKVVVVDDVLTTGKSLIKTIKAVEMSGGEVVAAAVMVKRGSINLDIPFFWGIELNLPVYEPEKCPPCRRGLRLEIRGKGGI